MFTLQLALTLIKLFKPRTRTSKIKFPRYAAVNKSFGNHINLSTYLKGRYMLIIISGVSEQTVQTFLK